VSFAIRAERAGDEGGVAAVIQSAFREAAHSTGTEAQIVDRLRATGCLQSYVALDEAERLVGQVAFSPVRIDGQKCGWYGLGPVAVLPERQGKGIGAALIDAGLTRLRASGARGCVVLGDPAFYARFGFHPDPVLVYPKAPANSFQRLVMAGNAPSGVVTYLAAFD